MENATFILKENISEDICISPFDPILDSEIIKISKIKKGEYKHYIDNNIFEKSVFLSESRSDLFRFHNIWDLAEICIILQIKDGTGADIFKIKKFANQVLNDASMNVSDEMLNIIDIIDSIREKFSVHSKSLLDVNLRNYLINNEYEIFSNLECKIDEMIRIIKNN